MPLPAPDPDETMPKDLQQLAGYMRQSYTEARQWWESPGSPVLQDGPCPTTCSMRRAVTANPPGRHGHRRISDRRGHAMSDAASTAQREQNRRQGLIVGTITLPFRLLGVLIGSLLFSIVVECVGMHLFWKDQGWRHSQQMLQYELGHLSNHFTRSVVVQEPGRTAHELVDTGYEWVFVRSGLLERMSQTRRARPRAQPGADTRTSATTSAKPMSGPRAT